MKLAKVRDMVKRFEVLTRTESDHFPLACELDCKFVPHSCDESVLSEINFTSQKWCTYKESDFQEKLNDEYTFEKLDNIRGLLNQAPDLNSVDEIVTLLQDSFVTGLTDNHPGMMTNAEPLKSKNLSFLICLQKMVPSFLLSV